MICKCTLCKRNDRIDRVLKGQPRKVKKLVEELTLDLDCAEMDLAEYWGILHGTWPGSAEYLEEALKKARTLEKNRQPLTGAYNEERS